MNPIPLFTSIPPKMIRKNINGDSVGKKYQRDCIKSWIDRGYKVHTINSIYEKMPADLDERVIVKRLNRDAFQSVGKHLPYLSDMIDMIKETIDSGPFVITNADILLYNGGSEEHIRSLRRRKCIIERRRDFIDIKDIQNSSPYYRGFDFFAFNIEDAIALDLGDFIFGIPWWDHLLPIKSLFAGFEKKRVLSPFAYHLKHDERWDSDLWVEYGDKFIETAFRQLHDCAHMDNYRRRYRSEVAVKPIYAGIKKRTVINLMEMIGLIKEVDSKDALLNRLSNLNINTIDSW